MSLREQVEGLFAKGDEFTPTDREVFGAFKAALNRGEVRAAERGADGRWRVNSWVKSGILVGFRMGVLSDMSAHASLRFFDKDTYPVRPANIMDNVTFSSAWIRQAPSGRVTTAKISVSMSCAPFG